MTKTNPPKKKVNLRSKIEIERVAPRPSEVDSTFDDIEDFIPGLIEEISSGVVLSPPDLTSPETAGLAVEELGKKLEELQQFQHRVRAMKSLLLQKRHALIVEGKKAFGEDFSPITPSDIED